MILPSSECSKDDRLLIFSSQVMLRTHIVIIERPSCTCTAFNVQLSLNPELNADVCESMKLTMVTLD